MSKILISLSGGLDSATLLALSTSQGKEVFCVGFRYGSNHNKYEIEAAEKLAEYYKVPYSVIDLSGVFSRFKSNLLGGEIPEGHYEDKSMALTVVPGRNIIFTSVLAGYAASEGIEEVGLGIHAGDHAIYPDCRPEFFLTMNSAVAAATDDKVCLCAPFLNLKKGQIVRVGLGLALPYELTRTCYKNQPIACGKCGSCQERIEAFEYNFTPDPVRYM
ncbi:MAG: 7-cyano-7-deazaguanine synthase QueC [Clostridia bacterium]|jgi:7-cyano-7-deazaguanine synthase